VALPADRVIRVMPDYGVDVPLWDDDGHLGNDPAEIADEPGLSPQLIAELRDWQRSGRTCIRPGGGAVGCLTSVIAVGAGRWWPG